MPSSWAYDLLYRVWAPWSRADRWEIRELVSSGRCDPQALAPAPGVQARAIDLGCGEGGVAIELAERGFRTIGVDFSRVALDKARRAADRRSLDETRVAFVQADLTAPEIPGVQGPFDLIVDYGTLDDFPKARRRSVAALVDRLARPGTAFFLYAFYGRLEDLPRISFSGPSRTTPGLVPGEVEALFGGAWDIERLPRPGSATIATFLLTKR